MEVNSGNRISEIVSLAGDTCIFPIGEVTFYYGLLYKLCLRNSENLRVLGSFIKYLMDPMGTIERRFCSFRSQMYVGVWLKYN